MPKCAEDRWGNGLVSRFKALLRHDLPFYGVRVENGYFRNIDALKMLI
jgi:hypothetical protein